MGGSAKGGFTHHGGAEGGRDLVGQSARAARNDPPYACYACLLQDQGEPARLAITACARKLLTILNAMFRNSTGYARSPG